jgi:hypothetical protein
MRRYFFFLRIPGDRTLRCAAVLAAVLAAVGPAVAEDADCSGCHDTAPVSADHMPVDEISAEGCGMCHEAAGDDPYFRVIHETHGEALGCESCHSDASAESAAKLKQMLSE